MPSSPLSASQSEPRPIDCLRDEVANASRRSAPMFSADEVQTALDEIDRLTAMHAESTHKTMAYITDLEAEITRHHADFERWEDMANTGAAVVAERDRLRGHIGRWAAESCGPLMAHRQAHNPLGQAMGFCEYDEHEWPCPTAVRFEWIDPELIPQDEEGDGG